MEDLPPPDADLDALLAAHALDALDADAAARAAASAAADPAMAARLARYRAAGAALAAAGLAGAGPTGEADSSTAGPPAADAVLGAALAARAPHRSTQAAPAPATAAEVTRSRAFSLAALVGSLAPSDWDAPTRLGRPVQAVLAHLAGQLERTATALGAGTWVEPGPDRYDHWASTAPWVERYGAGDPAALLAALDDVTGRLIAAVPAAAGDPADLASPLAGALVKAFELWMHADDVRLAVGRPLDVPDAPTLATLCTLAADAVPVTLALAGAAVPGAVVRLVLTGRGGGVWLRPLAPGGAVAPGTAGDVTIVAEAHAFCRLFHDQLPPAAVVRAVEGDAALAEAVLAAAGALAERT